MLRMAIKGIINVTAVIAAVLLCIPLVIYVGMICLWEWVYKPEGDLWDIKEKMRT